MTILAGLCCLLLSPFISGMSVEDCSKQLQVEECGLNREHRIVGGEKVPRGTHPWIVSLHGKSGKGSGHGCGGSIINERWIVTAAHCVFKNQEPSHYLAFIGLHKQSMIDEKGVQKIEISNIFMYDDYSNESSNYDIALLKTATPIDIPGEDKYANGICLPQSDADPAGNVYTAGWGLTEQNGEQSDILRQVVVPMVDREKCNNAYDKDTDDDKPKIIDSMICAGMEDKDSCQADSGGPLIQVDKKGQTSTLIGIVSFGSGCGQKDYPGVYTKVASFMPWMCDVIHENGD